MPHLLVLGQALDHVAGLGVYEEARLVAQQPQRAPVAGVAQPLAQLCKGEEYSDQEDHVSSWPLMSRGVRPVDNKVPGIGFSTAER